MYQYTKDTASVVPTQWRHIAGTVLHVYHPVQCTVPDQSRAYPIPYGKARDVQTVENVTTLWAGAMRPARLEPTFLHDKLCDDVVGPHAVDPGPKLAKLSSWSRGAAGFGGFGYSG